MAFEVAHTLDQANGQAVCATQQDAENGALIAQGFNGDIARTLTARHDSSPCADRGMDVVAVPTTYPINTQIALRHKAMGRGTGFGIGDVDDPGFTLQAGHSRAVTIRDVAPTLTRNYGKQPDSSDTNSGPMILPTQGMQVRRLTTTECERLQGFPDGHTRIPWRGKSADDCPDGPRYKALGNSMAVPCMAWIGRRIAARLEIDG